MCTFVRFLEDILIEFKDYSSITSSKNHAFLWDVIFPLHLFLYNIKYVLDIGIYKNIDDLVIICCCDVFDFVQTDDLCKLKPAFILHITLRGCIHRIINHGNV